MDECPPGTFFNEDTEICVPCVNGTYNHGFSSYTIYKCYNIPKDAEFTYLNATDVQCAPWWVGKPIYEDGEYEEGCVDAGEPSFSPTLIPTLIPTSHPSPFIAPRELPPPPLNENCTLIQQCNTFCCVSWLFFFGFVSFYGCLKSFIAFRQLREIPEDISEEEEEEEVSPPPMIAMVDIQEDDNVQLREQDSMRVAIPSPPEK